MVVKGAVTSSQDMGPCRVEGESDPSMLGKADGRPHQ